MSYSRRFVAYPMATGMYKYFEALMEAGVITGDLGESDLSENLRPIARAIHHVLSGGTVDVQIVEEGVPSRVQHLDKLLEEGTADANALNKAAGFYVSVAP